MGLRGPFPIGIKNCTSLQVLDLSGNRLTGQIPSNIADLPYLTTLDLSNNNLSGSIPPSIANLVFINVLRLNNNKLTGQIPPELSELYRLQEFSVANNRLSGQVPIFNYGVVSKKSYANNLGLCGAPLRSCNHENHVDFYYLLFTLEIATTSGKEGEIAISSGYMVTDWEKYNCPLSLVELKMATNDFDTKNVIGYGKHGNHVQGNVSRRSGACDQEAA
ncbi:hypothetical protein R6Q59_019589 [Mikania micrantha]